MRQRQMTGQLNRSLNKSLNKSQIEQHLKSAVDELTPDIFDKLDLSVPQEPAMESDQQAQAQILKYQRRIRMAALSSVACLCVVMTGGGALHYYIVNHRVESVIGIDVNPSVELSINKKERVLHARALNEDGEELLDGMDLDGVELNVAVNAVVGSMVTHGYLNDLDNAILVTVSNDSVSKSRQLRASIVKDIEDTLNENQLQAVVYDQQAIEDDETKELADEYDISYGKAYFLKELIEQNHDLSIEDMESLSSMTMEEIAREIAGRSYALGELADQAAPAAVPETEELPSETETEEETAPSTEPETTEAETTAALPAPTEPAAAETAPQTTEAAYEVKEDQVEIDYVDCEDDTVYVSFVTRVKWKNPTVAVRDEEGNSYAALVDETSRDDCVISVSGLEGGKSYTFVLGGLIPVEGDTATTVTGYFEKPEIAAEATESEEENDSSGADEEDDGSGNSSGNINGNTDENISRPENDREQSSGMEDGINGSESHDGASDVISDGEESGMKSDAENDVSSEPKGDDTSFGDSRPEDSDGFGKSGGPPKEEKERQGHREKGQSDDNGRTQGVRTGEADSLAE